MKLEKWFRRRVMEASGMEPSKGRVLTFAVLSVFSLSVFLLSGCLSVVRIPMPRQERYSEEGECTNRVWRSLFDDVPGLLVYPTVKMRWKATTAVVKPIPEELKGEKLYKARMTRRWGWIPLCVLWLTFPVDAAIDTVFLPLDICRR